MVQMKIHGCDIMNDSIDKIAIDAITIIQHLGQYELAEILMSRYEGVTA